MPGSPLIQVSNVSKAYVTDAGPVRVLDGVTLSIPEGEFVALVGASGSGKTTLLNLIGGLDVADAGRIEVDGRDLESMTDDARSAFRLERMGFIFQFFNLLPNLTVRENIGLPLMFLRRPEREARSRAESGAEEVGLADKLGRMAHQLSGGEMQRVAIARALVHQPRVLLADEPTGNLDSRNGLGILDLVRKLAKDHRATVVMATHDPQAAAAADRVVRMSDGRIVSD